VTRRRGDDTELYPDFVPRTGSPAAAARARRLTLIAQSILVAVRHVPPTLTVPGDLTT
jgi:hypothetical protein